MDRIQLHNVIPRFLAKRKGSKSDIWDKDVTFNKGELYLIEADSGTGKSTFCSYVIGYRHDFSGSLTFDGENISVFKVSDWVDIRKSHVSHLFQELRLFPELTAMENIEIRNKLTRFKAKEQIKEWFDALGIGDKMNAKIKHMSFGQQQRVAMMRSLAQPFDFILADEPISHLDDSNSNIMGEIMMNEAKRQGAGVIVTSIGKHINLNYDKTFSL